jgi:hypothetical protein
VGFTGEKHRLNLVIKLYRVNDAGGYVGKAWCLTYEMTTTKQSQAELDGNWTCGMMIELGFGLRQI